MRLQPLAAGTTLARELLLQCGAAGVGGRGDDNRRAARVEWLRVNSIAEVPTEHFSVRPNAPSYWATMPGWLRQAALIAAILCMVLAVWSVAATLINQAPDAPEPGLMPVTWWNDRPILPSPPQVVLATWNGLFGYPVSSPRSLIYHAIVTLEAALTGFALATAVGIALATAIVHSRLLDPGLLPWVIVSQSIPVLATAPMIVVVLTGGSTPIITRKPEGAWTHSVWDEAEAELK
jgi:hypothetical protein